MKNNNELNKAFDVALNKLKEVYEVEREKIESLIATQKEQEPLIDSFGRYLTEPEYGMGYFYANSIGDISFRKWDGIKFDKKRFELLNCFISEEKAEKYIEYKQAEMRILKRVAELNDGWELSFSKGPEFYSIISYDIGDKRFYVSNYKSTKSTSTIHLKSFKLAEQLISEMEDDLKIYFRIN